jgi:Lysylphosphatidylglycerol synthase TM region
MTNFARLISSRNSFSNQLKTGVFLGLLAYLGYVLFQHGTAWPDLGRQLHDRADAGWWLVLLIGLVPANQLLEARKWQVLLRAVAPVSLGVALRSVLAGVSLGMAVPAGDVAGRVLSLHRTSHQPERLAGIAGATLLAGGLQYYVALSFGGTGWLMQWFTMPSRQSVGGTGLLFLLILLTASGIGLALIRRRLTGRIIGIAGHWPKLSRWTGWFSLAADPSDRTLATGLGLAVARHLVFSAQFYASLRLFGIDLGLATALAGIWVVYLAKTVAPAINLFGDLGVREVVALWAFGPLGIPAPTLLAATLTLWLVNVAAPVVVGLPGLFTVQASRFQVSGSPFQLRAVRKLIQNNLKR